MKNAIILAGGVAKGAFGAGALSVLAARGIRLSRIVGASSGALNAAYWAAATRRGCECTAGERLVDIWLDEARWGHFLSPSARAIFGGRGLSDDARVVSLLRDELAKLPNSEIADIDLRIIVTSLRGVPSKTCLGLATTFEDIRAFSSEDFDDSERVERVIEVAAASASFPGLFAPVHGCVDGGLVSNAPIKEAIDDGQVDRVFVVVPYPQLDEGSEDYAGTRLAGRLLEVLIQERLFRDLKEAATRNIALADLGDLVSAGRITPEQLEAVLTAIGWSGLRRLAIVPIRPAQPLPGGSFDGFVHAELRRAYVDAGRAAAEAALGACAA